MSTSTEQPTLEERVQALTDQGVTLAGELGQVQRRLGALEVSGDGVCVGQSPYKINAAGEVESTAVPLVGPWTEAEKLRNGAKAAIPKFIRSVEGGNAVELRGRITAQEEWIGGEQPIFYFPPGLTVSTAAAFFVTCTTNGLLVVLETKAGKELFNVTAIPINQVLCLANVILPVT